MSAKRLAELGEEPYSTFRRPTEPTLKQTAGPKRSRGRRAAAKSKDAAAEWRTAVLALWFPGWEDDEYEVPCPVSGADLRAGWHPHHMLEKKVLWNHGLAARIVEVLDRRTGELVSAPAMYHPFIGMPVSPAVNLGFENGDVQISRHLIPQRMWDLAAVLDGLDPLAGPQWATAKLEADYR